MLKIAFKEWAVVCRAIGEGRQTVILRKGGIAETGGVFRPEHDRFWLYPTHFHEQQQKGIRPEFLPMLDEVEADRPAPDTIAFRFWVEVTTVQFLDDLDAALQLEPLHIWSADTVRQRFHYRTLGLYALTVRAYEMPASIVVPEHPAYAGCKTWVELDETIACGGAEVVGTSDGSEDARDGDALG